MKRWRPLDAPELCAQVLALATSADARALVDALLSEDARKRTRGLDALSDLLLRGPGGARPAVPSSTGGIPDTPRANVVSVDAGDARAPETGALAAVLVLATHRGFPEASALLVRLLRVLAAIDDPPRSGRPDAPHEAALWDVFRAAVPRLLRHARAASDPEGARVAALLASRFQHADADTEPLLLALSSGAPGPAELAPLLYALTRVQLTRGAALHPRLTDALTGRAHADVRVAVALALAEHPLEPEPRARVLAILREAVARGAAVPDPRSWGRSLPADALGQRLAALERV